MIGRHRRLAPVLAVPLALMMAGTAVAAPKTLVKSSGSLQRAVPASGILNHPLDIKARGTITDVDVVLAVGATRNEYLTLYLRHPSGRLVTLSTTNGGQGDGYGEPDGVGCAGAMRFDDEAVDNVQVFEPFDATIHGTFQPESKVHDEPKSGLGRLDGLRVNGRWELQVGDIDSFESQATLECFKLRVTYKPA